MTNRIADIGRPRRKGKPSTNGRAANGKAGRNGHSKRPAAPLDAVGDGAEAERKQEAEQVFFGEVLACLNGASPPPADAPETVPPSPPDPAGKDARTGRFQAGNKFGRGNPHARSQAEMHKAFMAAITPEGMQSLAVSLWMKARGGDMQAAQLVLHYMVGKPRTAPDPDRLDLDEFALAAASPTLAEVARANGDGMDPATAALLVRYFLTGHVRTGAGAKDALGQEELAAMLAVVKKIREAMEEAEYDPRDPFTLQFGELRKVRCKRGGA